MNRLRFYLRLFKRENAGWHRVDLLDPEFGRHDLTRIHIGRLVDSLTYLCTFGQYSTDMSIASAFGCKGDEDDS